MRFNTQGLESKTLASYDINCDDEHKLYQVCLYDSIDGAADEFNFMIDRIIPGILKRKFTTKDGTIIDVKGVEIRFPQFSAEEGNFLMTPFIARMTGQSYMCDIIIDYVEIKHQHHQLTSADGSRSASSGVFVDDKIKSMKIGSFHCLVGCNRDICMVKPDEFTDLNEWKMMLSECPGSPGAYVINNGAEKVVINDEKLRTNVCLTFKTKGDNSHIETRITCMDNSITSLCRMHVGRKRPTLKVLFPHLKKQKHYPLYLTFYLLFYAYNNTTSEKLQFDINRFEELIAMFGRPEHKDSIVAYLRPSKEKFIELFASINTQGQFYIDEVKIRDYVHKKLGNQKSIGAEKDTERFILANVSQNVTNEFFIQCKFFRDKIANLCSISCQTILCGCGLRDFDSRDDWDKKRSGSIVGMICNYVGDTIVKAIVNNTADNNGFDFGKSEKRKESIVEARKCETMNAAMAERNKITNQVDTRTNSNSLREVSQGQLPNVCPAQTPEGETCGLQKQKSALCHISNNQEYTINRKLVIDDLLEPNIYYFSTKKTEVYRYRFASVDFSGKVSFIHYGLSQETVSTEGIYVSTRILTIFKKIFKDESATYYIDEDTIYVRFGASFNLKQFASPMYFGGALFIVLPDIFDEVFVNIVKLVKNPEYKIYSSIEKKSDCKIKLQFNTVTDPTIKECTVINGGKFSPLFISIKFGEALQTMVSDSATLKFTRGEEFDELVVTSKTPLSTFNYEHHSGKTVAVMIPAKISKAFGMLLGVINEYFSSEKSKTYAYSFTFNGNVLTDSKIPGYIPKILWCNGSKLLSYLKERKRFGDLPYDCAILKNEIDFSIQYYDDPGRLMSPMLIVDDKGQLVIDKLGSYTKFTERNFDKSKTLIEELYNEGSIELIDANEMDTTLMAIDINECRTIYKLKRFLELIDLENLKHAVFKNKTDDYFRNEDIPTIKIHGNSYDIEFTTVKPSFPTLEFTQDGITYYGTYLLTKKYYIPVTKKIYKLEKPTNGRTKDSYYMVYKIDDDIKFITMDDDFETDGVNIYIDGLAYQINYVNFKKDKDYIYVDYDIVIQTVTYFERTTDDTVLYIYNGKVVDSSLIVDNHFYLIGDKYVVVDEVLFNDSDRSGLFISGEDQKKYHVYIPIENTDYTKFDLKFENSKEVDKREADLHMSIIRRQIDDINENIPNSYLGTEEMSLDDQFETTTNLALCISLFGNKRIMNILRRYIGTGFLFTHCLIDPNQAYSVISNFVPKADSNPGPRFSYQCSMGTQALGTGNCIWYRRYETSNKRLLAPVEHAFETVAELPLNQVTMPVTQNFVFLVAANYKGYEDPIIVSRAALSKFGRYEKEVCIKIVESSNRDFTESVCFPYDNTGNLKTKAIYRHLDKDGLPKLGSIISVGDCVIGKMKLFNSLDPNKKDTQKKNEVSYFAGIGDEGVVTDIVTVGSEGKPTTFRTIIVKLVQTRCQQVGDKMAARYSQKGTIGDIIGGMINNNDPRLRIVDDNLMPYVCGGPNHGMRAEIVFNPASFPSRMTCGLIKEILTAKAALYLQEKVDASNFHKLDMEYYNNALFENRLIDKDEHMDKNGDEIMCHSDGEIIMDSTTGNPMKFYIGIVAYQFLRHHVADKETARATGAVKSITNQPNEGRKNGGGQRMGEMERDTLLSSGAANTLHDRFMDASDGYEDVYCENCKNNSSISVVKSKICSICGVAGSLVLVKEPRIFNVFSHMMGAIGLGMKLTTKPVDCFQADISSAIKAEIETTAVDDM